MVVILRVAKNPGISFPPLNRKRSRTHTRIPSNMPGRIRHFDAGHRKACRAETLTTTCMCVAHEVRSFSMPSVLNPDEIAALHQQATAAARNSYSPYSHFRVGAAILLHPDDRQDGKIVAGTNVENASYRLTSCAEQAAIAAAVTLYGPAIRIRAVAVVNLNGSACMPCGACRQTILEFASPETPIFYPSASGDTVSTTLTDLLPAAFSLVSR